MIVHDKLMVGGQWVAPVSDATYGVISPSTEEVAGRVPLPAAEDVEAAIRAAREAFDNGPWPHLPAAKRASVLRQIADTVETRADEVADLVTRENGTPKAGSALRVRIAAGFLRSFAQLADEYEFAGVRVGYFSGRAVVIEEPVGVVAGIAAWNSPIALLFMKLGAALAAGCTIVLKPALETALSAYRLAELISSADIPRGVISVVPAGREAGEQLVTHPSVDKVAFTGSTAVGKWIVQHAARDMKRFTLELGGKSAAIMLDDVDIDEALPRFLPYGMGLAGQMCALQSRLLVPKSRHYEIVGCVVDAVRSLKVGDPFDPETFTGPVISARQRERVEGYIASGIQEGANLVIGGGRPAHLPKGYYLEPAVFTGVTNSMKIAREEIFGPVLSVIAYDDVDDAIRIANDSEFGLGGAVYTADAQRGFEVACAVRTGTIGVNGYQPDPMLPFGGFKQSGVGREGGPEGLREFLEPKAVYLPEGFDADAALAGRS